jgi:acetyltransferase-like isoleucine patch superfamily enzyme
MSMRPIIKKSFKRFFLLLNLPIFGTFLLIRAITGSDDSFASFSQLLSLIPGKIGVYIRAGFYHLACPNTSDEISIGFLTILSHRNTSIGRGVYIGPQSNIGMCSIGENTLIGSGVHILSGSRQHEFKDIEKPIQDQGGVFEKIRIGADCWIGNQSVVMSPIDNKSIIAGGSVVVSPVNSGDIVAGNPAKFIRNRLAVHQ